MTKTEVKNRLLFDKYNNVEVFEVQRLSDGSTFLQSLFGSKEVAQSWLDDICEVRGLNPKDYIIYKRSLRFY